MIRFIVCAWVLALSLAAQVRPAAQVRTAARPEQETWAQRRTRTLAEQLALTDAQRQRALVLFTDADKASEPVDERMAKARRAMREATRRGAPDAELEQLAGAVGTLTGQLEAIQAKADTAFYALLTAPQREKLDQRPRPSARRTWGNRR